MLIILRVYTPVDQNPRSRIFSYRHIKIAAILFLRSLLRNVAWWGVIVIALHISNIMDLTCSHLNDSHGMRI